MGASARSYSSPRKRLSCRTARARIGAGMPALLCAVGGGGDDGGAVPAAPMVVIRHAEITFHGLRHTHASQLIAGNVDIVTISKRLGHAKPSVTLAIYAHMFHTDDSKAAVAINAALG